MRVEGRARRKLMILKTVPLPVPYQTPDPAMFVNDLGGDGQPRPVPSFGVVRPKISAGFRAECPGRYSPPRSPRCRS
jgi:hypothetical protein